MRHKQKAIVSIQILNYNKDLSFTYDSSCFLDTTAGSEWHNHQRTSCSLKMLSLLVLWVSILAISSVEFTSMKHTHLVELSSPSPTSWKLASSQMKTLLPLNTNSVSLSQPPHHLLLPPLWVLSLWMAFVNGATCYWSFCEWFISPIRISSRYVCVTVCVRIFLFKTEWYSVACIHYILQSVYL